MGNSPGYKGNPAVHRMKVRAAEFRVAAIEQAEAQIAALEAEQAVQIGLVIPTHRRKATVNPGAEPATEQQETPQ
jgi:hypothetical protein